MENWIKFKYQLPTRIPYKEVKILFGHPNWSNYFFGIYTHNPNIKLVDRLSIFDQEKGHLIIWDSQEPTHYFLLPEKPEKN